MRSQSKRLLWVRTEVSQSHPLIHFSAPKNGALVTIGDGSVSVEFVRFLTCIYIVDSIEFITRLKYKVITPVFTHLRFLLPRYHMFRCAFRPFSLFPRTSIPSTARYFHRVTIDFIAHDVRGNLVTRKVPIIVGDPAETYILIEPGVGSALRAASPFISASATSAEDRCKLTFFHDSQYFGFGKLSVYRVSLAGLTVYSTPESSSYPRLYIPSQIPRQTESNTSPATLFLSGKMHEIVLDGTLDGTTLSPIRLVARMLIYDIYLANFAEKANATRRNLATILHQLKDM